MRVAILTNDANSYPKIMGYGLQRMLTRCGIASDVLTAGWQHIRRAPERRLSSLRDVVTLKPFRTLIQERNKRSFVRNLCQYDIVVVVSHLPAAYMRYFMDDEVLRRELSSKPIVLYDLVYLPTRGGWEQALLEGAPDLGIPDGGHFGIERYDWHLCVSVVSEVGFPREPQPCSLIGLDLDDESLFPEQPQFHALLDFERPGFETERQVQLRALERAGVPYTILKGKYSIDEIREIYRTTSIFFVAFRESFGLPICEIQACGGLIATPYAEWVPSHWIKDDVHLDGPGNLGRNFLVYHNDEDHLVEMLKRSQQEWSAESTRRAFHEDYPHYHMGIVPTLCETFEQLTSQS